MRHRVTIPLLLVAVCGCDKADPVPATSQPAPTFAPAVAQTPARNERKQRADAVKSASNLHQIGLALLLYQMDHAKAYPPDLGTLVAEENLDASVFVNPSTGPAPPRPAGPGRAEWVNENADYGYVRPAAVDPPTSRVVCYEKDEDDAATELTVLYADGRARRVPIETARRQIADAERAAR